MAIFTHEEHGLVEVSDRALENAKRGWLEGTNEAGETVKIRKSALVEVELTDDDEQPARIGDVFPAGIRDTYARGKTEEGAVYIDSADALAVEMRGWELQDVAKKAAEICGERTAQGWLDLYGVDRELEGKQPLNAGMVRMNLGNRIRGALKKATKVAEAAAAKADEPTVFVGQDAS